MYESLIAGIKKIPKVKKVCVVSQGKVVSGDQVENFTTIEELLKGLEGFSTSLNSKLSSFQMDTPENLILLETLGENAYLLVVGDRSMNVGRVRLELRKHVKK